MPKPSDLTALDSEDRSVSVAEARHMARAHMLLKAIETLYEMGMNPENRPSDRVAALRYVADFASEAQGNGSKTVGKLSPGAARLIAKLGLPGGGAGSVRPDSPEGERVHRTGADGDGDDS
jgi:hypothetical protein